jgi:drug/metabolite transporter, DME family
MGFLYLITAAGLWGLIGPVSKMVFAQGASPLETAFWRSTVAGVAFFIHWLIKRFPFPTTPREIWSIILFGVFGVALLEGSYVYAVHFGGAALASVLLYSAPIWVNVSSVVIYKEKLPARRLVSLTTTMIGILGLCLWGGSSTYSPEAIIWGLLSGLSYAAFYVVGKIFFDKMHPVAVYAIAFPVGSLTLLPFMLLDTSLPSKAPLQNFAFTPEPLFLGLTSISILGCLFLGIISTYLPYMLHAAGLKLFHSGRAAIITMVEPLVSVSLAAIFWGEHFSATGYFFAALVVAGVAIS